MCHSPLELTFQTRLAQTPLDVRSTWRQIRTLLSLLYRHRKGYINFIKTRQESNFRKFSFSISWHVPWGQTGRPNSAVKWRVPSALRCINAPPPKKRVHSKRKSSSFRSNKAYVSRFSPMLSVNTYDLSTALLSNLPIHIYLSIYPPVLSVFIHQSIHPSLYQCTLHIYPPTHPPYCCYKSN